jgi:hypothetical protein
MDGGGDVYLESSSKPVDHDAWLVELGASFHMTPHRERLYKYERYDEGDIFLGDDSTGKFMGQGKVKLNLMDGRIRTLLGVLHIPRLASNLISLRKMDDTGVKTMFENGTYRMVRGAMVLLKGVQFGTLYKL